MDHAATLTESAVKSSPLGVTWGKLMMWLFLCSDAMSFGALLSMYAALRAASPRWPEPGDILNIPLTAVNTFILICSSVFMVKAFVAAQNNDKNGTVNWLLATILGGATFLGIQVYEYTHLSMHTSVEEIPRLQKYLDLFPDEKHIRPRANNYCATFYATTCFHGMHVFGGVVYLSIVAYLASRGRFLNGNHSPVELVGLYWHFVDLVWIMVFTFIYLI